MIKESLQVINLLTRTPKTFAITSFTLNYKNEKAHSLDITIIFDCYFHSWEQIKSLCEKVIKRSVEVIFIDLWEPRSTLEVRVSITPEEGEIISNMIKERCNNGRK